MHQSTMQQQIEAYINAYNNFDIEGMLATLHPGVEFRNVTNGETTHTTHGIAAFREQAEQAVHYFSERRQTITHLQLDEQQARAGIDYEAVLAIDLPNGLKADQALHLKCKSVFQFTNGLISSIEDIS